MTRTHPSVAVALATVAILALGPRTAVADNDFSKPQALVTAAQRTIEAFAAAPELEDFKENFKAAKGAMIVPRIIKGGLLLGGSGGSGLLCFRDARVGDWTNPAFYTMGSVSFGLQIGVSVDQLVLLIMTENAVDAYLSGSFKIGADISGAAGNIGSGIGGKIADVYAYYLSKGAYGGIRIDGAVIGIRDDLNTAYYNAPARPKDILVVRSVDNPQAAGLRAALARASAAPAGAAQTQYPVPLDTRDDPSSTHEPLDKAISRDPKPLETEDLSSGSAPPVPAAPPVPTAAPAAPEAPEGETLYHVVGQGETLYRISKDFGVPVETLRRLNGIGPDNTIHPGQRLLILP